MSGLVSEFDEADALGEADFEAVPIPPPGGGAAAPEPESSPLADLAAAPLRSADGKELRVSFAVDPVMDLKAWAMAGHRIESRIVNVQSGAELTSAQRRGLMPKDFELIDLAALERGMSRLRGAGVPEKPRLIIQLSFASLGSGRGRAALLERARQLQQVMLHAAICELVDVETGVPLGRLSEAVALLRHYFRFVLVQARPRRESIETAVAAKASGLTVSAFDLGEDAIAVAAGMRDFVGLARGQKTMLMVNSLPTTDLLIDAMSVGFSHATLRAERPA